MKTRQSKLCGFWKGRFGNGCDGVNEDDRPLLPIVLDCTGLHWARLGWTALHWAELGSTGLNWNGLGPGGPSVSSVPGGPGGQGDPVLKVGQVIYMIRLVWVTRVVGFSGWSRWSRWSAWSRTGGGTKTDYFLEKFQRPLTLPPPLWNFFKNSSVLVSSPIPQYDQMIYIQKIFGFMV